MPCKMFGESCDFLIVVYKDLGHQLCYLFSLAFLLFVVWILILTNQFRIPLEFKSPPNRFPFFEK